MSLGCWTAGPTDFVAMKRQSPGTWGAWGKWWGASIILEAFPSSSRKAPVPPFHALECFEFRPLSLWSHQAALTLTTEGARALNFHTECTLMRWGHLYHRQVELFGTDCLQAALPIPRAGWIFQTGLEALGRENRGKRLTLGALLPFTA